MRDIILRKLRDIKNEEDGFSGEIWSGFRVGQSEQLKPFLCPNCKQPWDTRLTNSCQCGASIKRF